MYGNNLYPPEKCWVRRVVKKLDRSDVMNCCRIDQKSMTYRALGKRNVIFTALWASIHTTSL
jgi:hypothetical protein